MPLWTHFPFMNINWKKTVALHHLRMLPLVFKKIDFKDSPFIFLCKNWLSNCVPTLPQGSWFEQIWTYSTLESFLTGFKFSDKIVFERKIFKDFPLYIFLCENWPPPLVGWGSWSEYRLIELTWIHTYWRSHISVNFSDKWFLTIRFYKNILDTFTCKN